MPWRHKEYWIFCDESVQEGPHYSNFFGGVILPAHQHSTIENHLRIRKAEIGFLKELKWQRVSEMWLAGYQEIITCFFDLLRADQIRMRVMFRANTHAIDHLSPEQRKSAYFRLYYQFIKHAFGIKFCPAQAGPTRLRLMFDQFPHTREQCAQFKGFLGALPEASDMRATHLVISPDHITEIDSKEHVLLQCVDIIIGSMAFRLNEMHKIKPEGKRIRGKRTIAKDRLYRHILKEIKTLKPGFNPKMSTATEPYPEGHWSMPYRHWSFVPKGSGNDAKKKHSPRST